MWPGTAWLCFGFLPRRQNPCPPQREAPRAFTRAEPARRRRTWGARRRWGPGRRPAPTVGSGGEGRGQRSPETWRERGGVCPERLAGCRRSAGTPLAASPRPSDPVGVWVHFGRPFPASEWPRGRAPLGAVERRGASARTRARLLCFQSGRLRGEAPSGPRRAPAPPAVAGALGARPGRPSRAALGGVSGGRGEGQGRPAHVGGGGRTEARRRRFARPSRCGASRHHGPG